MMPGSVDAFAPGARLHAPMVYALAAAVSMLAGCVEPLGDDAGALRADSGMAPDVAPADAGAVTDAGPVADAGAGADAAAAQAEPARIRYANLPLVARIPVTAPFVALLGPASRWAEWVDIGALLEATGTWAAQLSAQSRAQIGHDLTDPAQWPRLWLDPGRFTAAAVLEIDPLTVVVGAHLIDAEAVRTVIYAYHAGREDLREVRIGDTTIVGRLDGWGPVFAWEGDEFWVVFGQGLQRGEAFHHAVSLARPGILLADVPDVQLVLEELIGGRAVTGILNIPALVQRGLRTEEADPQIARLRKKEAFARRFDEFQRANRLMSDRLRRQVMDLVTQQRRASEQFLRSAFYPFGPAAFSLRIEQNALQVDYVQRLVPGTLPATTLRPGTEERLARLFPKPPAVHFALSFDAEVASALARGLALVANRGEIALFEAELRSRTGVDLRRDLIQTAGGRLEVALDIDPVRFEEPVTLLEILHRASIVARWAAEDAAAVKLALGRIERGVEWVEPAGDGRFVVELPPLPQIWIQVGEEAVHASFDAALLARVDVEEAGGTDETPGPVPGAADAGDAGPADGGVDPDGGPADSGTGVSGALHTAVAVVEREAGHGDSDGSEVVSARVALPAFETVLESLVPTMAEAEDAEADDAAPVMGPGTFAFERLRGLALARNVDLLTLRGLQTREALSMRLRLISTDQGFSASAAEVIRASMPGDGGRAEPPPIKVEKPPDSMHPE